MKTHMKYVGPERCAGMEKWKWDGRRTRKSFCGIFCIIACIFLLGGCGRGKPRSGVRDNLAVQGDLGKQDAGSGGETAGGNSVSSAGGNGANAAGGNAASTAGESGTSTTEGNGTNSAGGVAGNLTMETPGTEGTLEIGGTQDADEDDGRTVLTLNVFSLTSDLKAKVYLFNAQNENYRVQIIEEEEEHESAYVDDSYLQRAEDYEQREAIRLMTGRGADIVLLGGDYRMQKYIDNGALVDLAPYIERDLNEEDYLGNILRAFQSGDGVYALPYSFYLSTLIGGADYLGKDGELYLEELFETCDEIQPKELMGFSSPISTLWEMFLFYRFDFTDREALKQCILLAEKYGDAAKRQGNSDGTPHALKFGEDFLFTEWGLFDAESIMSIEETFGKLGERVRFVKCQENKGTAMVRCSAAGISSSSKNKEGAWEFLRFLVSRDRQISHVMQDKHGIPVLKEAYMKMVDRDYRRKQAFYKETNVNPDRFMRPQEEYMEILEHELEGSFSEVLDVDYDAWRIVSEEVEFYFDGKKSLDAVLDIMQNRVRLYLDEK